MERTVPFALFTQSLVITWYHLAGHSPAVVRRRRAKACPSYLDMIAQLRRVLIAARISKGSAARPTPEQTRAVLAAWHAAAA